MKDMYSKQELVTDAVESCKAIICGSVFKNGYMMLEEFHSLALRKINALVSLGIVNIEEWENLRDSAYDYWKEQNDLGLTRRKVNEGKRC